jgi:hypothetical protein
VTVSRSLESQANAWAAVMVSKLKVAISLSSLCHMDPRHA